jgi:hypothetical protein
VKALPRLREAVRVGDGDKVLEVAQLHVSTITHDACIYQHASLDTMAGGVDS